jgi:hypothetical protein
MQVSTAKPNVIHVTKHNNKNEKNQEVQISINHMVYNLKSNLSSHVK